MNQVYVKPMPGRMPRHEITNKLLPEKGDWWPDNAYTRRLKLANDIEFATAPGSVEFHPAAAQTPAAPVIAKADLSLADRIAHRRADFESSMDAALQPVAPADVAEEKALTPEEEERAAHFREQFRETVEQSFKLPKVAQPAADDAAKAAPAAKKPRKNAQ